MTTNQTIDGVPRELLENFASYAEGSASGQAQLWVRQLRALLDAPIPFPGYPPVPEDRKPPAAQPQAEPVALLSKGFTTLETGDGKYRIITQYKNRDDAWSDYTALCRAEQPAPVAVVPDGYCIMPRQLTAENGAKASLLGEFKLLVTKECHECCELEEPTEGCSICDGEGEYGQKHTIPWDQIKFIYSKAVSGLAVKAESANSR